MFLPFLRIAVNAPRVSKKITLATALQLSKVFKIMDEYILHEYLKEFNKTDKSLSYKEAFVFFENEYTWEKYLKNIQYLEENEFINNDRGLLITDFGKIKFLKLNTFLKEKELKLIRTKEREDLEFEKSKVDFELSKETLKEFPKTKRRAKVAYIIAIVLAFVQVIQWIIKLLSLS